MDKETSDQLIDECISAVKEAEKVLNENIQKLKNGFSDLRDKQQFLEEWDSDHLSRNNNLLIDFDKIVSPVLTEQIQNNIQKLYKLKEDLVQYTNMIEREFNTAAPRKLKNLEGLLKSKGE